MAAVVRRPLRRRRDRCTVLVGGTPTNEGIGLFPPRTEAIEWFASHPALDVAYENETVTIYAVDREAIEPGTSESVG